MIYNKFLFLYQLFYNIAIFNKMLFPFTLKTINPGYTFKENSGSSTTDEDEPKINIDKPIKQIGIIFYHRLS
jgi:hypothetical protein